MQELRAIADRERHAGNLLLDREMTLQQIRLRAELRDHRFALRRREWPARADDGLRAPRRAIDRAVDRRDGRTAAEQSRENEEQD